MKEEIAQLTESGGNSHNQHAFPYNILATSSLDIEYRDKAVVLRKRAKSVLLDREAAPRRLPLSIQGCFVRRQDFALLYTCRAPEFSIII